MTRVAQPSWFRLPNALMILIGLPSGSLLGSCSNGSALGVQRDAGSEEGDADSRDPDEVDSNEGIVTGDTATDDDDELEASDAGPEALSSEPTATPSSSAADEPMSNTNGEEPTNDGADDDSEGANNSEGGETTDVGVDSDTGDVGDPECLMSCDDTLSCTVDSCRLGECFHTIGPREGVTACPASQYCTVEEGCVAAPACASDEDCEVALAADPCKIAPSCDAASSVCLFDYLDKDGDTHAPHICGGDDCNDDDGEVHPGERPIFDQLGSRSVAAREACDGVDNDCDGQIDGTLAACPEPLSDWRPQEGETVEAIHILDGQVYWASEDVDGEAPALWRCDLASCNPEALLELETVQYDKILFTEGRFASLNNTEVCSCMLPGCSDYACQGRGALSGLAFYENEVLLAPAGDGVIISCPLADCASPRVVYEDVDGFGDIVTDGNRLLFAHNGDDFENRYSGVSACTLPDCPNVEELSLPLAINANYELLVAEPDAVPWRVDYEETTALEGRNQASEGFSYTIPDGVTTKDATMEGGRLFWTERLIDCPPDNECIDSYRIVSCSPETWCLDRQLEYAVVVGLDEQGITAIGGGGGYLVWSVDYQGLFVRAALP